MFSHHSFLSGGNMNYNQEYYKNRDLTEEEMKELLNEVYSALCEKGYNPTKQIAGYILSEDPVYITDWKNARGIIAHINRDVLLDALIKNYLNIED